MRWSVAKSAVIVGAALILYYIKLATTVFELKHLSFLQVQKHFINLCRKRCGGPTCRCCSRLDNKTVIITGGTSGIGLVVAEQLAKKGATVVITARDLAGGLKIQNKLRIKTKNPLIFCHYLDLNNFDSIHKFVLDVNKEFPCIHLLINNAGVFFHPPEETVDKFDVTFQTNYLGHFLLTELLVPRLPVDSRVIFLSSAAHFLAKSLDLRTVFAVDKKASSTSARFLNYSYSKLCLLLYSKNLSHRLQEREITVYSVDPGTVETSIYRHFPFLQNPVLKAIQKPIRYFVVRSPLQGAQTVLHCALSPYLKKETGHYYSDLVPSISSELSLDLNLSSLLYEKSRIRTKLNTQHM